MLDIRCLILVLPITYYLSFGKFRNNNNSKFLGKFASAITFPKKSSVYESDAEILSNANLLQKLSAFSLADKINLFALEARNYSVGLLHKTSQRQRRVINDRKKFDEA